GAVRGVAAAARHAHPVPAGAPRLADRPGCRHPFQRASRADGGALPRPAGPPGPRDRGPADERRVRRHAVHPGGRRRRARPRRAGRGPGVQAGHLAGRGGEPDRAQARLGGAVLSGPGRPAPAVHRHRGARRPDRGPGGRAGQGRAPVSGLAAEVTAALGRSILPSVIARGAAGLRVVAAEDGVVTLAADGSPGAGPPARDDRARRGDRARGRHRPVLLPGQTVTAQPRVLLLVPARSYRAADFIAAAERMRLDLVVASDGALPLGGSVIGVRSAEIDASARRILARAGPLNAVDAVVAADTPMLVLAATVAA